MELVSHVPHVLSVAPQLSLSPLQITLGLPLVVAAEELRGHPLGFRDGFGSLHDHEALKVVEMVANNNLDSIRPTHSSIHILEEGQGAILNRHSRSCL